MNIDNIARGLRRARLTSGGNYVPDLLHEPPEWTALGDCLSVDPALFHPEPGNSNIPAKTICADCPVRTACLEFALATDDAWGIFGGLSPKERKRLKRQAS